MGKKYILEEIEEQSNSGCGTIIAVIIGVIIAGSIGFKSCNDKKPKDYGTQVHIQSSSAPIRPSHSEPESTSSTFSDNAVIDDTEIIGDETGPEDGIEQSTHDKQDLNTDSTSGINIKPHYDADMAPDNTTNANADNGSTISEPVQNDRKAARQAKRAARRTERANNKIQRQNKQREI